MKSSSRNLSARKVKAHAHKIFKFLFNQTFHGEVYLCGGAFKPLLDPALKINGLDLWVSGQQRRERLAAALIAGGAELVQDHAPYFIRCFKDGTAIEISYQNAPDSGVAGIVENFDIASCAIGAAYDHGTVRDIYFNKQTKRMLKIKVVLLQESYLPRLREVHGPNLLCEIDRMQQLAADTGFDIDEKSRAEIWEIFESEYSPEEKQVCLDTYMETIVAHKSRCNQELLRRAVGG